MPVACRRLAGCHAHGFAWACGRGDTIRALGARGSRRVVRIAGFDPPAHAHAKPWAWHTSRIFHNATPPFADRRPVEPTRTGRPAAKGGNRDRKLAADGESAEGRQTERVYEIAENAQPDALSIERQPHVLEALHAGFRSDQPRVFRHVGQEDFKSIARVSASVSPDPSNSWTLARRIRGAGGNGPNTMNCVFKQRPNLECMAANVGTDAAAPPRRPSADPRLPTTVRPVAPDRPRRRDAGRETVDCR